MVGERESKQSEGKNGSCWRADPSSISYSLLRYLFAIYIIDNSYKT